MEYQKLKKTLMWVSMYQRDTHSYIYPSIKKVQDAKDGQKRTLNMAAMY